MVINKKQGAHWQLNIGDKAKSKKVVIATTSALIYIIKNVHTILDKVNKVLKYLHSYLYNLPRGRKWLSNRWIWIILILMHLVLLLSY